MTIRVRLLVIAVVPALALVTTTFLLRSGVPAGTAMIAAAIAAFGVVIGLVMATVAARAAGRLAVGQAARRNKTVAEKGAIEVFVNLVRRMQGLVDQQIEFLEGLEAEEQDPDTLENLFKLDQSATRVRRNAASLLSLAGKTSSRGWERPLAMSDVIRAGLAEVEDIGRVDLLVGDNSAMIGSVAADATHLLSELLENATRWSPPDTRVDVSGTPAGGGYAITIENSGIGMTVDEVAEANHILAGPPLAEATVSRSLGLVVAGRLARRLGIVVRLAPAGTGGVIAKILVPPELMVAADETIGLEEVAAGPQRALPFALARQEKRARISSQRSATATPARPWTSATPPPGEPPVSIRPTPSVRPARFAAAPSLAGSPPRSAVLSVAAKEDEYRRHLERATAAGLVRRVPKASLAKDTGGGANDAPGAAMSEAEGTRNID